MIVTSIESGWEVVFQRSHGLLAGQLAESFREEFRPRLWVETLEAILSHDDHKEPFNARYYVTDLGAPKDFTLVDFDARERVREARRRIAESTRNHRWIGLLLSKHVEHLYGGEAGVHDSMRELLGDERDRRKATLRDLGRDNEELEDAYQLLRWCDRLSLILSRGRLPAMERRIEITHGLRGQRYDAWRRDDQTVGVDPWPFAADEFAVNVEVKRATKLAFEDDRDLIDHLDAAEVESRTWRLRRDVA